MGVFAWLALAPVVALASTPNPNTEPRTRTLHRQRDGAVGEQDHVLHHHGVRSLHIVLGCGQRKRGFADAVLGRTSTRVYLLVLTVIELKVSNEYLLTYYFTVFIALIT